jgi:alpha-1,6-mannosyltransferase
MSIRQFIIVGILMELCYVCFYFVSGLTNQVLLFFGINVLTYVMLAFTMYRLRSSSVPDKRTLALIIGFGILFRLTLVPHGAVASDDIYRYVWDGKVAAHGINPFAYAPDDPRLSSFHTVDLPSKVNFPQMRTIYPPLAQLLFLASHFLFGDSIPGLKLLLVFADVGTMFMLLLILGARNMKGETILLYAWSPLPILYFGLDGHIDALGIPFLLLAIYLIARNRKFAAAISLGLAVLAKLYPLFIAPVFFRLTSGAKRLILPSIPVLMLLVGCWFYYEPSGGLFESFTIFNSVWEFNGSIFHVVYLISGTNELAHLVCSILFFCWLGWVFVVDRSFIEKIFLVFLGFVVLAPVVQPWYLTWLAALIVLRWSLAVFMLLGLSVLSNIVVFQYHLTEVWRDRPMVLLLEYLPFYAILVWEVVHGRFSLLVTNTTPPR